MISAGSILTGGAVLATMLAAAFGAFYLYRRKDGGSPPFFTPRLRRLSVIERTSVEGGRKLVLVRRDDKEHLLLIGGPIDIVIETNIRREDKAADILELGGGTYKADATGIGSVRPLRGPLEAGSPASS